MVYTERADVAAVSCGTSHSTAVCTPLRWIFKNAPLKANHSCRITCERSESAGEQLSVLTVISVFSEAESGKLVAGRWRFARTGPNILCSPMYFPTRCVWPKPDQVMTRRCNHMESGPVFNKILDPGLFRRTEPNPMPQLAVTQALPNLFQHVYLQN